MKCNSKLFLQPTNTCSNCGNLIFANDLYCSYCGNLNKSKVHQDRWEFLSRYTTLSSIVGFTFFTLYLGINIILSVLLPVPSNINLLSVIDIVFIISFIGAFTITFLVLDKIYLGLPRLSMKRFLVKSFIYNYIGDLIAIIINYLVIVPVLNVLANSNITTSIPQPIIIWYPVLLMLLALISFFGLAIFSAILYLIKIKHDPTKKIPFRALLSNKLLILCYLLGIIMSFGHFRPINISISSLFDNYETNSVFFFTLVTIDIGSIMFLNLYLFSTGADFQLDLLNDFNNAMFIWIVLSGILFLRDYYSFTKNSETKLSATFGTIG